MEASLTGHSLLAVFAHPDDESLACGGLLAMCAERGARVSLLCLTRGEHGPGRGWDPGGRPGEDGTDREVGRGSQQAGSDGLRVVRERELRDAASVLGIDEVVLLDHEDGMIPWIDAALVEADILEVIRRVRPDVVVTFDEDGLYWHPDHVAVHERTTAAVATLGPEGPALRYVTIPPGAMRTVVETGGAGAILGVTDVDGFGAMAPPPSYAVGIGRSAVTKLAALRCHRSQMGGGPLDRIELGDAERLLGVEHYRRAEVGSSSAFIDGFGTPPRAPGMARPAPGA